jgi:hypothetical protein
MTKLELFQQFNPDITKVRIRRDGDDVVGWELLKGDEVVGYGFNMNVPDSALDVPDTDEFDFYEVSGIFGTDFKVEALDVKLHEEYGGTLWAEEIVEVGYKDRYIGLVAVEIDAPEDGGKVDVISGSTISSNAMTKAVREKLEKFESLYK